MVLQQRTAVVLFQTVILAGLVSIVSAAALPQPIPVPASIDKAVTKSNINGQKLASTFTTPGVGSHIEGSCGFQGNPDVYGLGIRIGIYTQWLSTMISNWLVTKRISNMRDINTCFQLAMLFAIISMTNQDPKPHAIDIYIIIMQIVGSLCTLSAHNIKKTEGEKKKSQKEPTRWSSVIRFVIYWCISAYSTFFWFSGYRRMQELEPGCEPIAWFFAKVSFYGWFRIFLRVISTIALVCFTILSGFLFYKYGQQMIDDSFIGAWRRKKEEKRRDTETDEKTVESNIEDALEEWTDPNKETVFHKWTPGICVALFTCSIAAIECMIKWNEIVGVEEVFSTGQLIPLVTGAGGLMRVLYIMAMEPEAWIHIFRPVQTAQGQVQQTAAPDGTDKTFMMEKMK